MFNWFFSEVMGWLVREKCNVAFDQQISVVFLGEITVGRSNNGHSDQSLIAQKRERLSALIPSNPRRRIG